MPSAAANEAALTGATLRDEDPVAEDVLNFDVRQAGAEMVLLSWTQIDPRPFGYTIRFGPQG